MKTRLNISFLLFFLAALSLGAQNAQERIFEEQGEQLMNDAAKKLKSYESLKIEFTYEMANESLDVVESMDGTLIAKGDKYHMEVGDNAFISDGTTVWSYMEEIGEVHINLVENTDGSLTPTSILEGFEQDFRAKFIRQETHKGKKVDIIDLVPKGPQPFFKYRVALDASTKMIVYTSAYDRQGGTYTYHVNLFQTNPKVSEATFSFNVKDYPGIEVIDLR